MKKTSLLISALMTILLGVLFIIFKEQVVSIALSVFGIVLIITAILELIKKNWGSGIVKAFLGIAVLLVGGLLLHIALIVIGVVLLIYGALELIKRIVAIIKKQNGKLWATIVGFISPIVCIIAAIALISGNFLGWAIIVAGVLLIINGALSLIEALASKN